MKESSLEAWQVFFLFAAVLTYFVLLSGKNPVLPADRQNKNYARNQPMLSPVLTCTSSVCNAPLFSSKQTSAPKPLAKNKEKIASSVLSNQKTELESGYCISVPVLLYHHIQP